MAAGLRRKCAGFGREQVPNVRSNVTIFVGDTEEKHKHSDRRTSLSANSVRPEFVLRNIPLANNLIIDLHNGWSSHSKKCYWDLSVWE
jgi:hypothetical protein